MFPVYSVTDVPGCYIQTFPFRGKASRAVSAAPAVSGKSEPRQIPWFSRSVVRKALFRFALMTYR
jgi:hypothetical protein